MIDFGVWSRDEAKAYRDAYAAAIPLRERWLADELRAHGHDTMLLTGPEQLLELWAWATSLIDAGPTTLGLLTQQPADDPQPGIRPPWYDQGQPDRFLSDGALWLIDLLGGHLATLVVEAAPQAHWDVYRAPRRTHDVDQHRTKLFGTRPMGVDPAGMIHTAVIGHLAHGKPWNEQQTLATLYTYTLQTVPSGDR